MSNKFLRKMYSKHTKENQETSNGKNPNRISGGLRAQGADSLLMAADDGQEKEIPTKKYVESLEENYKQQQKAIHTLQETINRQEKVLKDLENNVQAMYQKLKDK